MAEALWTDDELSAVIEAYLQMLALEEAGHPYSKAAVRRALLAGPVAGRANTEQRMQNISFVLQGMGRNWIEGYKSLPNVGVNTASRIQRLLVELTKDDAVPIPTLPPVEVSPTRKLKPTGYWLFLAQRQIWNAEAWLALNERELLYKVADHNRTEVRPGDLGVLRVNATPWGPSARKKPAAIYAVVEVVGPAQMQPDPDLRAFRKAKFADADWRAPIRIVANLVQSPIIIETLPPDSDFHFLREPVQSATIPISRKAFATIFREARLDPRDLTTQRLADDIDGILRLEQLAAKDPVRKERTSTYIERGKIGEKVKALRQGRCQLCEALGKADPVAFRKNDGTPYSEAHHVLPVSLLKAGSLSHANIMVLCPNHHREAHHGDFRVSKEDKTGWIIEHCGKALRIEKISSALLH